MINILVIDNHKLVRASLCRILDDIEEFNVIGETHCAPDALKLELTAQPDIIVMDLNLPNVESILCLRRLQQRFKYAGIIVVSSASTHLLPLRLFKSGVSAFISKKARVNEPNIGNTALIAITPNGPIIYNVRDGESAKPSTDEGIDSPIGRTLTGSYTIKSFRNSPDCYYFDFNGKRYWYPRPPCPTN